ncbi:MAG: class I SAM-dependent methyltransferase [Beutenbergiaceae bacterium]
MSANPIDPPSAPAEQAERARAQDLLARWDAQQTGYIRHRSERFATMARLVAQVCTDVARPRILDLAGGPGSLGFAVTATVPDAQLVVADKDPVLRAIAENAAPRDREVLVLDADLDSDGWSEAEAIRRAPFDAVISSTALHWLRPDALVRLYFRLAQLVRPGGVFLNGDHLLYDQHHNPVLREVAKHDDQQVQQSAFAGQVENWDQWWQLMSSLPEYADAMRQREIVWGGERHEPVPKVTLGFHIETLRSAGFQETGTAWQYLDDYVVYGIR